MLQPLIWSKEADDTIRRMRAEGATWAEIAATIGLHRNTVIEPGRRLRAVAPAYVPAPPVTRAISDDPNRLPLPAFHPVTWALIDPGNMAGRG